MNVPTEYITSRKNPLLQQVRKLLSSRKERERTGLFVADGTKLLDEAVRWYEGLDTVIFTEGNCPQLPENVWQLSHVTSSPVSLCFSHSVGVYCSGVQRS